VSLSFLELLVIYLMKTVFSHPSEQGAEFLFRVGDSGWSGVLNFEAPSADTAVSLSSGSTSTSKDIHLGVSWAPGLGKYKLVKVITIAPRYMIKNELPQAISFRECGDAAAAHSIEPGAAVPLLSFTPGREAALSLKYPGVDCSWYDNLVLSMTRKNSL
jgi:vacuolar protein sorting-associated protein 13A/C